MSVAEPEGQYEWGWFEPGLDGAGEWSEALRAARRGSSNYAQACEAEAICALLVRELTIVRQAAKAQRAAYEESARVKAVDALRQHGAPRLLFDEKRDIVGRKSR